MPFTPDNALDLLFPAELVPQRIKDQLPPELHVRLTSRQTPFISLSDSPMRPAADSPIGFDRLRARPPLRAHRAHADP